MNEYVSPSRQQFIRRITRKMIDEQHFCLNLQRSRIPDGIRYGRQEGREQRTVAARVRRAAHICTPRLPSSSFSRTTPALLLHPHHSPPLQPTSQSPPSLRLVARLTLLPSVFSRRLPMRKPTPTHIQLLST